MWCVLFYFVLFLLCCDVFCDGLICAVLSLLLLLFCACACAVVFFVFVLRCVCVVF